MNQVETDVIPTPPSLVNSLLGGFETISNHIGLILFCIGLDVLLWLGPQLRLERLIQSFLEWTATRSDLQAQEIAEILELNQDVLILLGDRFNLITLLRTFPIGIPSLMIGRFPSQNPLGEPFTWQLPSAGTTLILVITISLFGIILGSFFFKLVAQATIGGKIELQSAIKEWPQYSFQIILLTLLWVAILFAISIPLSCILPLVLAGAGSLGTFLLVGFGVLLLWLLLPLAFAPHGIFANQEVMWESLVNSAKMTRITLPTTGVFVLTVIVLSFGMDLLWNATSDASWLTTISIIAHAFIATSLLAASFIYYRDANNWVQRIMQKTKLTSLKT